MAPTRQFTNHPDPMDLWLDTQGYYRKSTARDGSCLFRAVAEQLFNTQKFHIDVRNQCVEYMLHHSELFLGHEVEGSIDNYIEHMRNPNQWGGPVEILAMSLLYRVDFLIFKEVAVQADPVTNNGYEKVIMLCFSHDRHYDSVYLKEYTKIAGFCQSLVYEVLYKDVFGMKDVDYAVDKMLHYKPLRHRNELGTCGQRKFFNYSCSSIQLQRKGISIDSLLDDAEVNVQDLLSKGITPFPYKVAKSLEPDIFRNVEFDVWIDYRRGLRHGYFGSSNELRVGVKCLVKIDDNTCVAHIQEMAPDKGPVVLFVEELGEKRTVPYESLELLPQDQGVKPQLSLTYRSQRFISGPLHVKQGMLVIQDCNGYLSTGVKLRKGKTDDNKGKENHTSPVPIPGNHHGSGGRRTRTKSVQSNVTDLDADTSSICGQQDSGMVSYSSYSMENCSAHTSYQTYQAGVDMGAIALPVQAHLVVPPQQRSTPILVPLSPRVEDMQPYWLTSHDSLGSSESDSPSGLNSSGSQPLSPTDFFRFVPYTPPETSPSIPEVPEGEPEDSQSVKDQGDLIDEDGVCNSVPGISSLNTQINYNAPKSVLDNGADLPMSDIQTLRFFYNLGNDVYRSQCGVYSWGTYSQACAPSCNPACTTSCSSSPGLCGGNCSCGPVCITAVPTIHHLLEPTTPPPPSNTRRRRRDTHGGGGGLSPSCESESGEHTNHRNTGHSSHSSHSLAPRFRKDLKGKGKRDLKVFEGQPLVHQQTLQTPVTPTTPNFPQSVDMTADAAQGDSSHVESNDLSTPIAVSYPQSYGYVYYPSSPVLPYSPVETDPYFNPFRIHSDGPQSPQCYPMGSPGEMGVYGTSPQFPVYATSPTPHYLVPSSPGIYVGSPPTWGPLAASSPQ